MSRRDAERSPIERTADRATARPRRRHGIMLVIAVSTVVLAAVGYGSVLLLRPATPLVVDNPRNVAVTVVSPCSILTTAEMQEIVGPEPFTISDPQGFGCDFSGKDKHIAGIYFREDVPGSFSPDVWKDQVSGNAANVRYSETNGCTVSVLVKLPPRASVLTVTSAPAAATCDAEKAAAAVAISRLPPLNPMSTASSPVYPPGQFSVALPRRGTGIDLCAVLSHEEKTALVGPNPHFDSVRRNSCDDLRGTKGYVLIYLDDHNVDTASEQNTSDQPPHRDIIRGNSAWITPSSTGCGVEVAIHPNPSAGALYLGGDGTFTCDQLQQAAQLIMDRLPPQS